MQPRVNRSQKFLRIEDVSEAGQGADACAEVFRVAQEIEGKLQLGAPTYFVSEEMEEQRESEMAAATELPYFILEEVKRNDRVLEFRVRIGRESDHDGLMGRDGSSEPMRERAAVRRFGVWIVFPSAGDYAFMISETRGRTYVGELLLQWLTRSLQREAVTVNEKGKKNEGPWLNWRLEPRIDGHRLDGILSDSGNHAFRLRRHTVTSAGGRSSYDLELTQIGLKKTSVEKLLDVIMKMNDRRGKGSEQDRRKQAAKDVLSLVDADVAGVEFTDGEISFTEKGKVQTINAETVDRLFIYPLGSKRPSENSLLDAGLEIVGRIAPTLGVQIG